MKPPCEVIAMEILPAARAYVANKLAERGLSQTKTAELMGLTQPAVSQYRRHMRGFNIGMFEKDAEVLKMMNALVEKVARGVPITEQTLFFRDVCRVVLSKGMACGLHKKNDRTLDDCKLCIGSGFCSSKN